MAKKKKLFAGLFKKKAGGTFLGNMFRKVTHSLADTVGLGSVVDALNPIPTADAGVQDLAKLHIEQAAAAEKMPPSQAFVFAKEAAQNLLSAGATPEEAAQVQHVVATTAQQPAVSIVPAASPGQIVTDPKNLNGGDVIKIIKGGLEGAKNGAVDTYLDETEDGKKTKKAAVEEQGSKIMPYLLAGALAFIFWTQAKK